MKGRNGMDDEVKKKMDFIVDWFNRERFGMKYFMQAKMSKAWIRILVDGEEYEVALALKKEMEKVRKNYFKLKKQKRGRFYKTRLFLKKLWRKICSFKLEFTR